MLQGFEHHPSQINCKRKTGHSAPATAIPWIGLSSLLIQSWCERYCWEIPSCTASGLVQFYINRCWFCTYVLCNFKANCFQQIFSPPLCVLDTMSPEFTSDQIEENNEWYSWPDRCQEFNSLAIVATTVANLIIVVNAVSPKSWLSRQKKKMGGGGGQTKWEHDGE